MLIGKKSISIYYFIYMKNKEKELTASEKRRLTCLKKYGVDNPLKCKKIKQRINKTNIERYGSICPLNNEKIREKAKQTLFNNYGVYNVAQSDVIKNKIRQNCLEKYNVDWHSKRPDVWIKQCVTLDKQIKPNYKKYKRLCYLSIVEQIKLTKEKVNGKNKKGNEEGA